jgi:hypothetical protein
MGAILHPVATSCLNCNAALSGKFCAHCGQRAVPPYPTVRELASEAAAELWGWDGRIAATFRMLLLRPGALTREFLEGRRARYLAPFRLYLIASVSYFVLAASSPEVRLDSGETLMLGLRFGVTATDSARDATNPNPGRAGQTLSAEERAQLRAEIDSAPRLFQPLLTKALDDPSGFRRDVFATMPKLFFVLLPFFALVVSWFYPGRRFPEHLYFAIHVHAYLFFALALTELAKFSGMAVFVIAIVALGGVVLPVYATVAFKRVYGGSMLATVLKSAGISVLYGVGAFIAFLGALFWLSSRLA